MKNEKPVQSFRFSKSAITWLEIILEERFGHKFILTQHIDSLCLNLPDTEGCIYFDDIQGVFNESISDFPCYLWVPQAECFQGVIGDFLPAPSMSELANPLVEFNKDEAIIHYDILGLTYWMLTRLEEVGHSELDNYQRFPAISSHAYQNNYLDRPIVDEWLGVLGQVIKKVWPDINLKQNEFSMKVSHDVDAPSQYAFQPWRNVIRMMAGHLLKRQDIKACLLAPYIKLTSVFSLSRFDPFNTFEWLMDVSEANNTRSAFYFICGRTHPNKDADYEIEHPIMRSLIKRVHERGHEVGLHPSYNTYLQPGLIKQEYFRLKNVCAEEGVEQDTWGGRMHYLRWQQPITMSAWADAGLDYDSTLGYADRPGFRCGTCIEYPAFDAVRQLQLGVRIRPLIVMESTLMGGEYMNLDCESILTCILQLKDTCKKVGGCFTLLWHNSTLISDEQRNFFVKAIEH